MCQTQENKYYVPPPFNQVLSLEERNGHENRLEQGSVTGAMTHVRVEYMRLKVRSPFH